MLQASLLDAVIGSIAPTEGENSDVERKRAMDIPLLALVGADHPLAKRSAVPLDAYRASPIAMPARDHAPDQFDYFIDILSQGEGREALSVREFRPTGTGGHADITLAEIGAGRIVGFGTPASATARASHLRLLPFEPALTLPTYISWQPQRSPIVDSFVEELSALS